MSFRCLSLIAIAGAAFCATPEVLRVCADPNNLPFSNEKREGFENRIAEALAKDLNAKLDYIWILQRKSYVKNTLEAGLCDLLIGMPDHMPGTLTTAPYYRSTYVFVTRKPLRIESFDDERLKTLRIGIHVVGDDFAPPARALASRGILNHIRGYSLYGAYGEANPPARLLEAVSSGEVDVGIAWGPLAGFFGKDLEIVPVSPQRDGLVPFAYDISAAVSKDNAALRERIQKALEQEYETVAQILRDYRVPLAPQKEGPCCEASRVSH